MAKPKKDFKPNDRQQVLLWCDRHCCLCKKQCGALIEIHHIDGISNDIDNAIPLCFDCHGTVQHYNVNHPKGTKFKNSELKDRRKQVYEEFTRHLVPPIKFSVCNHEGTPFPEVGFNITHNGDSLPVRAKVIFDIFQGAKKIQLPSEQCFYDGSRYWNLNPHTTLNGHFTLPINCGNQNRKVEIIVSVSIFDCYNFEHRWLPVSWTHFQTAEGVGKWALNPSPSTNFKTKYN